MKPALLAGKDTDFSGGREWRLGPQEKGENGCIKQKKNEAIVNRSEGNDEINEEGPNSQEDVKRNVGEINDSQ